MWGCGCKPAWKRKEYPIRHKPQGSSGDEAAPHPITRRQVESVDFSQLSACIPFSVPLFVPPRRKAGRAKARIAQLVEQLAFNQLVLGSSPSPRTFFYKLFFKELE